MGRILILFNRYYYRLATLLGKTRVSWGRKPRIQGGLRIRGPGSIVFGDNIYINGKGHIVTPYTHSPEARISIGNNVFLNGTRFGCMKNITIGDACIIGDARIMDTDFHPVDPEKRKQDLPGACADVVVEENVWIGAGVFILKGVRIGRDSTVGAGAVVLGGDYPERSLIMGNPARVIKILEKPQ